MDKQEEMLEVNCNEIPIYRWNKKNKIIMVKERLQTIGGNYSEQVRTVNMENVEQANEIIFYVQATEENREKIKEWYRLRWDNVIFRKKTNECIKDAKLATQQEYDEFCIKNNLIKLIWGFHDS